MRPLVGPDVLWFVRHGQSEGNVLRDAVETAGGAEVALPWRDADTPLSALGVAQARALGAWFADQPVRPTAVLTSPYQRARDTAHELLSAAGADLAGLLVDEDERLRDRDMGVLERLTWAAITERFPAEAARAVGQGFSLYRPPGGESWADIALRLRSLFHDLAGASGQRVLVVAHDVVIQLARAVLTGLDEASTVAMSRATPYPNAGLATFERTPDGYVCTTYGWTVPVEAGGVPATEERDAPDALD